MSDDSDRTLSFIERKQLLGAKLTQGLPGGKVPPTPEPPSLPPRKSSVNGVKQDRNEPPVLPPRRPSVPTERCSEAEDNPAPPVHVSLRKSTIGRRAVKVKRIPSTTSDKSLFYEDVTLHITTSPSSCNSSPETLRRGNPGDNLTGDNGTRGDDTLTRENDPIPRNDTITPSRPAPTPPQPFIQRSSAVLSKQSYLTTHRQSLPPSLLPPPNLRNRRHSYDDKILLDQSDMERWKDDDSSEHYNYARRTDLPHPKPPSGQPYTVSSSRAGASTIRRSQANSPSIYKVDLPPQINMSTHPRNSSSSRGSSTTSSPSTRRTSSPLTVARAAVPGKTPPPIPKSLPPPLSPRSDRRRKSSTSNAASVDANSTGPSSQQGTGLDELLNHNEYEDDDDIYGQIAADLDEITYEQSQDFFIIQKNATSAPNQQSKSGFREYWHERKEVVDSGILETDQLGKMERARQEAMYEIFTTEETYRKSLEVLDKQFISDNLFSCYLDEFPEGPESILCNIDEIMSVSDRLLQELRTLYHGKITVDSMTSILRHSADRDFPAFVTYCANTANQQDILSRHKAEDPDFEKFLTDREVSLHGQNLTSYLILPMQRICRMPLLLDAVIKKTEDSSPDKKPLMALYNDICEIVERCNEGVRRAETRKKMENLDRRCDFAKIKLKSFTDKADRLIIKEGLGHILKFKNGKMMGSKINMWLFTDYLVIGVNDPKDETKIILTECSPRQLVQVLPNFVPPSSYKKKIEHDRIFNLQLLSPPDKKFIIQCQSPTEKDKWMEVLKRKENSNEDETIYEEWDVPLVQAKHLYKKTNEDDLELQQGEICRVLKKYTDGWCYGQRQSDGVRGWFPMSFTVEIESDHAKYKEILRKQQLLEKIVSNENSTAIFSTMHRNLD